MYNVYIYTQFILVGLFESTPTSYEIIANIPSWFFGTEDVVPRSA